MAEPYILIVEDSNDIAKLIGMTLDRLGLANHHCLSGQKALDFLEGREPPTLIVLDIGMPGINGWEFLDIIKQRPAYDKTLILVCTAFSDPANRTIGALQNVDGYITKPFGPEELKGAVSGLLEL